MGPQVRARSREEGGQGRIVVAAEIALPARGCMLHRGGGTRGGLCSDRLQGCAGMVTSLGRAARSFGAQCCPVIEISLAPLAERWSTEVRRDVSVDRFCSSLRARFCMSKTW